MRDISSNSAAKKKTDPVGNWSVWRQGDDGNQFLIEEGLSEAAAEQMVAEFEARGHKQLYWATRKT